MKYRLSCRSTNKIINQSRSEHIGVKLSEAGVIRGNGGASQTICYTIIITVPRSTLMTVRECVTNSVSSLLAKFVPLHRP